MSLLDQKVASRPPEDSERKLVAIFQEFELKQIGLLEENGKRVIELASVLLGLIFGIAAFGDKFPPGYISDEAVSKVILIGTIVCYLIAMVMGAWTIYPRKYSHFTNNLTEMRSELNKIIHNKVGSLKLAGLFFVLATSGLVTLVILIVLEA